MLAILYNFGVSSWQEYDKIVSSPQETDEQSVELGRMHISTVLYLNQVITNYWAIFKSRVITNEQQVKLTNT